MAADLTAVLGPLLDQKLASLDTKLIEVLEQLSSQTNRLQEAEQRISNLEDDLEKAKQQIDCRDREIMILSEKVDDLENSSRRNNLRINGIPESTKGTQLECFLTKQPPEALGLKDISPLIIERFHRIGPEKSSDNRPRPVIIKLLNYSDKMKKILAAYRKQDNFTCQQIKLLIFQDFSALVAAKRRTFAPVCKMLLESGCKFSLLYPAKLRVIENGKLRFFEKPEDAFHHLGSDQG